MAYDTRRAQSAAEPAGRGLLGLSAEWNDHIATGVVVAVAVMIVALIAVLMGMA